LLLALSSDLQQIPSRTNDKTIEALLYSFFIYLTFTTIFRPLPVSVKAEKVGALTPSTIQLSQAHSALRFSP
jgi:hypothetical protein